MVELMLKVVKPVTELEVTNLKPLVMSAGKNSRSIWTAEYLGLTRKKFQKKTATSVTSVADEPEAAFVNTFDAHQEHISEAENLQ